MEFKGIEIYEEPRHKSVKRAQNITRDWQLANIPLRDLDQTMTVEEAVREHIMSNGELMSQNLAFQESALTYQTIMLGTTLSLKEILRLEDELTYGEFEELYTKCCDAIGGDAVDFFDGFNSATASKAKPKKKTTKPKESSK